MVNSSAFLIDNTATLFFDNSSENIPYYQYQDRITEYTSFIFFKPDYKDYKEYIPVESLTVLFVFALLIEGKILLLRLNTYSLKVLEQAQQKIGMIAGPEGNAIIKVKSKKPKVKMNTGRPCWLLTCKMIWLSGLVAQSGD